MIDNKKGDHALDEASSSNANLSGIKNKSVTEQSSDQSEVHKTDWIANEVPIAFSYNGHSHAVMMASPIDLNDFAIGFSLTERIVDSKSDILEIDIRQAKSGITIQCQIKPHLIERLEKQRRQLSGRSSCGICGITDIAAALPNITPLKECKKPNYQIINLAVKQFEKNQPLQDKCGAMHCAALFNSSGDLISLKEDVGRHNALDKLIGASIDTFNENDFILMSSRASHELIVKVATAGVHSLVTISAATNLAIEMAEKTNVNLIGFIRGDRQIIYFENN